MRLLHVLATLDPAAGGFVDRVVDSSFACVRLGHEVEIATLDAPTSPFIARGPLPIHALGPARNRYGFTPGYVGWLRTHATEYDAVIVHGLWHYHGLGAWIALRDSTVPYLVFAHGMLDPRFKQVRTRLYWPFAEYRVLRDAQDVLFTSEDERVASRASFRLHSARETVVPLGRVARANDEGRSRDAVVEGLPARDPIVDAGGTDEAAANALIDVVYRAQARHATRFTVAPSIDPTSRAMK